MSSKYIHRKDPDIIVDAVQYNGGLSALKEFFGDRYEYVQQGQAAWVTNGAGGKMKVMESYWVVNHSGDISTLPPESFDNLFTPYNPKAKAKVAAEKAKSDKVKGDRKSKLASAPKSTKKPSKAKSGGKPEKKKSAETIPDARPMATKTVSVDQIALAMMFPAPPTTAEIVKLKTAVAKVIRELERAHK